MVKLFIPLILIGLGLLSDIYLFHRYINTTSMWRWIWWLPMCMVIAFLIKFLFFNSGLSEEYTTTNLFLLLMGLVCIPKMLFALCSLIPKIGEWFGAAVAIGIVYIILYGITIGFSKLTVKEIVYESSEVPEAFDGYRIVQFSDAHVGSFYGPYKHLLKESMDTINNLHPDLICFTGDIENFSPKELLPHAEAFSSLRAKDGVVTIMGNHDYSSYVSVTDRERAGMVQKTKDMQRSFGWILLDNSNIIISRTTTKSDGTTSSDTLNIVGEANWGQPPFPQYGKLEKALAGINTSNLTVMLSHDPTAWRSHILPVIRPAITLSGHTHGSQISLFGWVPVSLKYDEWGGEYHDGESMLYVSTGIGGNFPFRFNMPREVIVITLKKK